MSIDGHQLWLKRPTEFSAVSASRQAVRGENFELRFSRNHGNSPRLGFVIPKRLARRSVMRNLFKRLAREAFRHALPTLPMFDMVLRLTRKPAQDRLSDRDARRAWRGEIDALLTRIAP
ncbi:MAG: ribonuclease P protein component [Candidatus Nitricoxidivorans perseverans]|uniref:Ribonuclease P protein component n=1 Tax=Candidatus Nitricoxidivorans perseverans TaxID=2975601 RepID=A0AA49FJW3_9PROT|nr:MAG: ribonuclease P protein component [Candidatus Nitricoxidivorans perseverans]